MQAARHAVARLKLVLRAMRTPVQQRLCLSSRLMTWIHSSFLWVTLFFYRSKQHIMLQYKYDIEEEAGIGQSKLNRVASQAGPVCLQPISTS